MDWVDLSHPFGMNLSILWTCLNISSLQDKSVHSVD